jgi:hypothetical protein
MSVCKNPKHDDYERDGCQECTPAATVAHFNLGSKLEQPQFSSYRSLYPVLRNDVLYCFLGLRTGWGKRWQFFPLKKGQPSQLGYHDGFVPCIAMPVTTYVEGGRATVLARLIDGTIKLPAERFKDASELAAAETANNEASRVVLDRTLANLRKGAEAARERRDAVSDLLAAIGKTLTDTQQTALCIAVSRFEDEVKSFNNSIEAVEQRIAALKG